MALSKERQGYHLTPRGWKDGSHKGDALGGVKEAEIPSDSVLTIWRYNELPSAFSEAYFYEEVVWKCYDGDLIAQLKKKPEG